MHEYKEKNGKYLLQIIKKKTNKKQQQQKPKTNQS